MGIFDFFDKLPSAGELKGGFGEYLTKYYLKLTTDDLVLHDILINGSDGYTSQIDLILVSNKGLFVVEVKYYEDAKIYGDPKKSKWYYYRGGKKFEIYSPVRQNKKHVEYLKAFLSDFGEVPCFSVITMICNDFKISAPLNEDPENPTTVLCSSLPYMSRALAVITKNKPIVFDELKKKQIYDYISTSEFVGKEARQKHKEEVKSYTESLDKMSAQKICPYCKTELVLRKGKFGEFYGCANYPKCKYTLKK